MPIRLGRQRRRDLVHGGVLAAFGVGVGAVGFAEAADVTNWKVAVRGAATAAVTPDRPDPLAAGRLQVTWSVRTTQKLVALTFDDGPHPRWTPMVLDILHQRAVPGTFFMVGEQVRRHAQTIRDRMTKPRGRQSHLDPPRPRPHRSGRSLRGNLPYPQRTGPADLA